MSSVLFTRTFYSFILRILFFALKDFILFSQKVYIRAPRMKILEFEDEGLNIVYGDLTLLVQRIIARSI
jgi:hypothetical protein